MRYKDILFKPRMCLKNKEISDPRGLQWYYSISIATLLFMIFLAIDTTVFYGLLRGSVPILFFIGAYFLWGFAVYKASVD